MTDLTPIMLSALQHYSYCPRQCALIHQEQTFDDNVHTVRGHLAHERVDSGESGVEYGVRVERSLPLYSERYGLTGRADAVEFLADGTPYPIEYKQGKRQKKVHDEVQLVGQVLCLEEMTGKAVAEGAIFHHKSRRRRAVPITAELRAYTIGLIAEVRALLESGQMPPPVDDRSLCQACSLQESCQPELVGSRGRIRRLHDSLFIADENEGV
ncbi:CRISPR-associated protein Cas4 [uncultured Thiothrix sp.]|uniref:CRISPR-associated protein Cas4 n=1 Tax=uncultured Thiothrix sp. TaxID=223185 RepID=UPI0026228065|nr:CRISPR-associated protein Cas4 [uncultured Thiothrix sp.]HRJ94759.1 CRISPR-associated protein Cas4 [Candidatus Thiothrix moscowensis]